MRRNYLLVTIIIAWTCVSLVYYASQLYIVTGVALPKPFLPNLVALFLLLKNMGEPFIEKVFSKYILPDSVVKYVHKYPILKTVGLASAASCSIFEFFRTVFYTSLVLTTLIGTGSNTIITLLASMIFRVLVGLLLIFKLPMQEALPRLVGFLSRGAASEDVSAVELFHGVVSCLVRLPWSPPSGGEPPCEVPPTADSAPSAIPAVRAKQAAASFLGSPTLLAVLLVAAVEASVVDLALSAPLTLQQLSYRGQDEPVPLLSPARPSELLFSPTQSCLLVAGASVQCLALMFVAGYLMHRRAIALELRSSAAAAAAAAISASPRSSTAATASVLPAPPPSRPFFGTAVLRSLLDCDGRLSLCLENCRGSGRLSSVDAFAAGLQSAVAAGTPGPASSQLASTSPSPSPSNNSTTGKAGGKARLSVVIPPHGSQGSQGGSGNKNSGIPTGGRSDAMALSAETGSLQRPQFAPQPYMLTWCVVLVLLVAILQAGQTLLGFVDSRCSVGNALAGLAGVVLVTFLRDAVPKACISSPSDSIGAAPPRSVANAHNIAKH